MMQSRADAQESEVRTFIKEIRRYSAIEELDEAMLNRLISRILIGEVKKVDGQKVQKVKIVYNFVGEIPEIAAYRQYSPPRTGEDFLIFGKDKNVCVIYSILKGHCFQNTGFKILSSSAQWTFPVIYHTNLTFRDCFPQMNLEDLTLLKCFLRHWFWKKS